MQLSHLWWVLLMKDGFRLGNGVAGDTCLVLNMTEPVGGDKSNCGVKVCPAWAVSYEMTCHG